MGLVFLTGGARSGKSALAVRLAARSDLPVRFIATAPSPDRDPAVVDADMAARIERHREERRLQPGNWTTIEEPLDIAEPLRAADGTFTILDCLTLWVSNLMFAGRTDEEIEALAGEAADVAARITSPVVVVTNEVGMGVHPDHPLGRRYRDVLGRVNQRWAAVADEVFLMVAGRALRLTDPLQLLEDVDPGTVTGVTFSSTTGAAR